jgi:alpha-amylase
MAKCTDNELLKDWNYLQVSDHFYYMSTKYFSDGEVHSYFNPFDSPYEAFINYMNVLSDFKIRLNTFVPENEIENQIAALHNIIIEKEDKIKKLEASIVALQKRGKKGK